MVEYREAEYRNHQINSKFLLTDGFDTCTAPNAVQCKCTLLDNHSELLNHR